MVRKPNSDNPARRSAADTDARASLDASPRKNVTGERAAQDPGRDDRPESAAATDQPRRCSTRWVPSIRDSRGVIGAASLSDGATERGVAPMRDPRTGGAGRALDGSYVRKHLSRYLQWLWHFQDYRVRGARHVRSDSGAYVVVEFQPKYSWFYRFAQAVLGRSPRLSLIASIRLANAAAIIAAGAILGKPRKDGEVIAGDLTMRCADPIDCDGSSLLPITVWLTDIRDTPRFKKYCVHFEVGSSAEHYGQMTHFYENPEARSSDA